MSADLQVVRELDGWHGDVVLVKGPDGKHFTVSSVVVPISGFETLVFPAREDGEPINWLEVAGGKGCSRAEALAEMAAEYERVAADWSSAAKEDDDDQ